MTFPIDAYSLRARVYPAIIAVAPTIALILTLTSWTSLQPSQLVVLLAVGVLLYASSEITRSRGKAIEAKVFEATGGKPTVRMLRHRDVTFPAEQKKRYLRIICEQIGRTPPTAQGENDHSQRADECYEACGTWLRENTRDVKKFHVLFEENISYGFRRNLLGVKPIGLSLNIVTVLIAALITYLKLKEDSSYDYATFSLVLIIAAVHAVFFTFIVRMTWVVEAAKSYGRQLILCTEAL